MEKMGKADTHVHTFYSGFNTLGLMSFPESVIPPEKQVDDARRRGLNVLCITDHNEVAGGFRAQEYAKQFDDIEVVVGDEVMCDEGEVIGLWLTEKPKKYLPGGGRGHHPRAGRAGSRATPVQRPRGRPAGEDPRPPA